MAGNAELARSYTARALALIRAGNGLWADVERQLRSLAREIAGRVATADLARRGELSELIREIDEAVRARYGAVAAAQSAALAELIRIEAAWARRAGQYRAGPSDRALQIAASRLLVMGGPIAQTWDRAGQTLSWRIGGALRTGAANRDELPAVRAAVQALLRQSGNEARTLTQTATRAAAEAGRRASWEAAGVEALLWLSVLDGNTTEGCLLRAGKLYTLDLEPIEHGIPIERAPPRHWGCLLGDTHVSSSSRVTGVFERRYDGEIVVIRTAGGNQISVTPNHPILTRRGWVPAGLVNEGDDVAHRVVGQQVFVAGDSDGQNMPPRFEDVTEALRRSGKMGSVPVPLSAEDFHGDGEGSDVAVVWSDCNLGSYVNAALNEHFGQFALEVGSSSDAAILTGLRGPAKGVETVRSAPTGSVSGLGVGLPLLGSEPGGPDEVGLASTSQRDSVSSENAKDRHSGNSVAIREDRRTIPGQVFVADSLIGQVDEPDSGEPPGLDEPMDDALADARLASDLSSGNLGPVEFSAVIQKSVREYSGHVYNLETEQGAYCANGIIVHNCRSILVPQRYAGRSDPPADGGAGQFDAYLASLSQDEQDDLLGAGRAELYRRGVITQRDLVDQSGRLLTLAELRALP